MLCLHMGGGGGGNGLEVNPKRKNTTEEAEGTAERA